MGTFNDNSVIIMVVNKESYALLKIGWHSVVMLIKQFQNIIRFESKIILFQI